MRNIIAERVLGLPQDPRADKGVAFNDIPSGKSYNYLNLVRNIRNSVELPSTIKSPEAI